MKTDRCSFCKGKLYEEKTEFVAKVEDEMISIKDVPAYVCENCGVAYFTPEISRIQIYITNEKMNENFYPESEEILFTNREKELETLEFYLEEFLNGIKENVCIFGLRRIGKTILIS